MATIKHIFKGESLTVLLTFPEAYDMARIEKHEIYIGATAFTGVVSGQTVELKLTSEQTDVMYGKQEIRLWLDDSVLGVKKPYCGDIIVSNSNAKPANDSTSFVSDIIIPIVISETTITVGDVMYNYVKGDKGDPFTYSDFTPEQIEALKVKGDAFEYSDFTPEQIALLQQPASDAAGSIALLEGEIEGEEALRVTAETNRNNAEGLRLSAEIIRNDNEADRIEAEGLRAGAETGRQTAEGLRVQAEQARQTNTATAIQNAETATTNANNAASLANEKAGLANNAALLANEKAELAETATTQANDARDGANSAAQSATNLVNSYATDLAAKELKANKQNSLIPDGTGTKFPTVDAVNEGLLLKQDANLIASYIHSGNLEVAVQSIDIASNTFTKMAHGLINGDRVAPILNINVVDAYPYNVYPIGLANPDNGYYVINATNDTFQLSLTSGGASITLSTNATMNLTKWHFEKRVVLVYENTNILFSTDFRIVYGLRILTSSNFYSYNGISGIWSGNDYYPSSSNYNNTYAYPYAPINPCHFGHGEQKFMSHYMMNSIHLIARIQQTGIVDRLSMKFIDISKTVNSEQIQSKTLILYAIYPANGFSFKIYKI